MDTPDLPEVGRSAVNLLGVELTPWTESEVVEYVFGRLSRPERSRGGWIVTPNIDILRQIVTESSVRELVAPATLRVPDGMPLIWASRLQGTPLPERVTGASLLLTLCEQAAQRGRMVYLLGGTEGVAARAASELERRYPGLQASGWSPPFGLEGTTDGRAAMGAAVAESGADLVFCGFGFPKQERVIAALAPQFPDVWFIGCGAALAFAAGQVARAPVWMQRRGIEWLHRLIREPRRMFPRYVVRDIPFALKLMIHSARRGRLAAARPAS